jgi:putative transposase
MLTGIKFRAYPTAEQKQTLSQWMGAARLIWNAKCEQWRYESTYARKYLPIGTYAAIDASYAQFKERELTPFLFMVPAEILKDAANSWRDTMRAWMNPDHPQKGPARKKRKDTSGSIYLESRLFHFAADPETNRLKLFIGTTKNNIGYLDFNQHGIFQIPKSIRIRKKAGLWWVSFCYDDGVDTTTLLTQQDRLAGLRNETKESLQDKVIGVDRGIAVAAYTDSQAYDYTKEEKASLQSKNIKLKRYQRRMARQVKGSKRRNNIKSKIARVYEDIANVRNNFCHQVSHALTKPAEHAPIKLIVMEDLKIANMTRAPAAKKNKETGRWEKNGAAAKAGLNRSILSIGWYKLEEYTKYKAYRRGGLLVKISPQFSSQECADCDHIHPDNRVSQTKFVCRACGHRDNADHNAARVLKKRAINLVLNSGAELSAKGVLFLPDRGRGAKRKTFRVKTTSRGDEASKKMECVSVPEAAPL